MPPLHRLFAQYFHILAQISIKITESLKGIIGKYYPSLYDFEENDY